MKHLPSATPLFSSLVTSSLIKLLSTLLIASFLASSAHAQLYKSIGADGKITYSDLPPPATARSAAHSRIASPDIPNIPTAATSFTRAAFPYEIAESVKNFPVTLYSAVNCTPCNEARRFLNQRGIPFTEKTVSTNDDIAQLRQISGDAQLPFLLIGRAKQRGFDAENWQTALTAAGYPESNRLPKNYRNPPATSAAANAQQPTALPSVNDEKPLIPETALPPALGNAPPGFRF